MSSKGSVLKSEGAPSIHPVSATRLVDFPHWVGSVPTYLPETDGDELLDERFGEWTIDRKLQCTLGGHVAGHVIRDLGKHGTG